MASGAFGGMPATGAIARTAVNVRAGARTRVAAIVHSILILLIALLGLDTFLDRPLASIGAIVGPSAPAPAMIAFSPTSPSPTNTTCS